MAKDVSDTVRDALSHAVREVIQSTEKPVKKGGMLSGARGLAAGAGLAAAAPLAKKGIDALRANGGLPTPTRAVSKAASKAGDKVGSNVKDAVSGKVDEAGGAGGIAKKAASGLLPGVGDEDSDQRDETMPGVGKGRRMPVQQAVDVAVPLETAYNQWTQFEDWPEFMHRVTQVVQEDEVNISFTTKIWGKTKEFEAKIVTQRPDDRVKWAVTQGITHTGVVSFHELAPRLTRIEVTLDVEPGGLLEKAARGMRHIKRAVRADLARFKAFIEVQEQETGAWRGVIEDGEVVEEHDESYDDEREYSEVEDIYEFGDDEGRDDEDEDEDERQSRRGRSRTAATSRSSSSRSASGSGSSRSKSGSSKPKSSSSRSGSGSSKSKSKSSSSRSRGSSNGSSRSKSSSSRARGATNGSRSSGSKSSSSGGSSRRRSSKRS